MTMVADESALVEAVDAVIAQCEDAFEEGDEDWSGEFDVQEFINSFRANPRFVRKVSLATDLPVDDFKSLSNLDLEMLFQSLDTDTSGTLTIDEFAKGLVEIRLRNMAAKEEEAKAEEEQILQDTFADAAAAFSESDLGVEGELDLQGFVNSFSDPAVLEKIAAATQIPIEFFASIDLERLVGFFQAIDTDCSGSISIVEWVKALCTIRQDVLKQQKAEEKQIINEAKALVEEAFEEGDEDWSGEFEFNEFVKAFRENPRFLRKLAQATDIPVEDFKMLQDADLMDLFSTLDEDYSGTVSFDEFTKGLLQIRLAREAEKKEEAAAKEEDAMDEALIDAADAYEDMSFGYDGELSLEAFKVALQDPDVMAKISAATQVPMEFFATLDDANMDYWFNKIDTDKSGSVSFNEWVTALLEIRKSTYEQEKEEQAELEAATKRVSVLAEAAFEDADEDWSGELTFESFLHAFRTNPRFLHKVALAMGLQASDLSQMTDRDFGDLFLQIDVDHSGSVSFEEFVKAIAQIRVAMEREMDTPAVTYPFIVPGAGREELLSDIGALRVESMDGASWELPTAGEVELAKELIGGSAKSVVASGSRCGYDERGVFIHNCHQKRYFATVRVSDSCFSEQVPQAPLIIDTTGISDQSRQDFLATIFNRATNGSGVMSEKELKSLLRRAFNGRTMCDGEFMAMTVNLQTTQVSSEDFAKWLKATVSIWASILISQSDFVFATFRMCDKSGMGLIPHKALHAVLGSINHEFSEADVKALLDITPTDENGQVDYEEFIRSLFRAK